MEIAKQILKSGSNQMQSSLQVQTKWRLRYPLRKVMHLGVLLSFGLGTAFSNSLYAQSAGLRNSVPSGQGYSSKIGREASVKTAAPQHPVKITMQHWKPIFEGIEEARGTVEGKYHSVMYVMRVDLHAHGISVVGTPHAGSKATISETVSKFAREQHVQVAINGSFFFPCCASVSEAKGVAGLMITDGQVIAPPSSKAAARGVDTALLITRKNKAHIERVTPDTDIDTDDFYTAITGVGLVADGEVVNSLPMFPANGANPRTAVGLSSNNRFLYLVAIDGRRTGYSMGTTLKETAEVMLALGARNAVNFDGGGSTTMVMQNAAGKIVEVNRPSGKQERYDANALGIHALPLKH